MPTDMQSGSMYDAPSTPEPEEPMEKKDSETEYKTTLVPKGFFKGKDVKVGDKESLEIVHIYGDEIEVKCVGRDKEEKDDEKPRVPVNDQIDSMAAMNEE